MVSTSEVIPLSKASFRDLDMLLVVLGQVTFVLTLHNYTSSVAMRLGCYRERLSLVFHLLTSSVCSAHYLTAHHVILLLNFPPCS